MFGGHGGRSGDEDDDDDGGDANGGGGGASPGNGSGPSLGEAGLPGTGHGLFEPDPKRKWTHAGAEVVDAVSTDETGGGEEERWEDDSYFEQDDSSREEAKPRVRDLIRKTDTLFFRFV